MRSCIPMLLMLLVSASLQADEKDPKKPTEPTPEQLAAAKKAYAKFGATYYRQLLVPGTKQLLHTGVRHLGAKESQRGQVFETLQLLQACIRHSGEGEGQPEAKRQVGRF